MNPAPTTPRQFDVMPDGSGFLGFVSGASAGNDTGRDIRIVHNWFTELNRLVPTA
jgi:hypothetical protein